MKAGLVIRLCAMMFLQYLVWGLWMPLLSVQLPKVGITESGVGYIQSMLGFGSVIGPFILAQLADRYFAAEKVMAVTHLLGGALLIGTSYAHNFWTILILFFAYCNLYFATVGLTNSITFRSVGEENQNVFPLIRLFGTVGWIVAGLLLTAFLRTAGMESMRSLYALLRKPELLDAFWFSGIASILYGLYCFALPHTPPVPAKETDPIDKKSAVLESLELMRNRSFAVLVTIAGLIGIEMAFYFQCEAPFLIDIGLPESDVSAYMTIGQIAEIFIMLLVPVTVAAVGVKNTMLLGAGAWALRFGLSIIGFPKWLMITSILLHGFCFGFFFVVAQMYVDRAASVDIKSSAQNLLIVIVYGLGAIVGYLVAGWLREYFSAARSRGLFGWEVPYTTVDWRIIWAIPFTVTVLCMIAFALLFRDEKIGKEVQPEPALT